jgi:archaellum biogenesis ATPase FlaH
MFNESEVYKFWDIFRPNNQLTEIRLISNDGKIASGYFTDPKTLIEAVRPYAKDYSVYFTINPINPDCYGRPQKDKIVIRAKNTTTDSEIIARDYVLLDLDSKRATGVNATEEQLNLAKQKANVVYKFLIDNGFYEPIVICSGSGVHIYIRCALLPTEENNQIIKRFTQAMSMLFSDNNVDIDEKVFNLGRISRVCGYYNRKGSPLDKERPQRLCTFAKVPNEIKVNQKEYFEKIAKLYPEDLKPTRENNYRVERFDLQSFLQKHNIRVTNVENVAGGKKYILEHCPFNENHKGKDAVIFQRDSGEISFHCFHNSCSNNGWRELRLLYEPDAYDKRYNNNNHRNYTYDNKPKPFVPQVENDEKGKKWLSMKDIKQVNSEDILVIPTGYYELDKKIMGLSAGELTILSGLNSCGKTSWLDCLALNTVNQGFKVGIWSGEMQDWRFKNWISQIAAGKNNVRSKQGYDNLFYVPNNISEKINTWLDDKLFLYNNSYGMNWQQLFNDIKELVDNKGVHLILLDNLATLNISDYDGEKNTKQTKFIVDIKEYAKQKNIHICLVAHPRKENFFLRKESVSGTADLTNLADNVFLLHRVTKDFETRAGEFFGKDKASEYMKFGNVLEVAKNREHGVVDLLVGMYFEVESRRLKNDVAEHIVYGWNEEYTQTSIVQVQENEDPLGATSNVEEEDPF